MNFYFKVGEKKGIPAIPKACSMSIAYAIIEKYYPELNNEVSLHTKTSEIQTLPGWQHVCPKIEHPSTVYALIRNPIDRFVSGVAFFKGNNIESVVSEIEDNTLLRPQISYLIKGVTKLYRLPDHLENFVYDTGLNSPLPLLHVNKKNIVISDDLKERIKLLFLEDYNLYESINEPGKIYS